MLFRSVTRGMTYKGSGVDIDAQDRALARIRGFLRETKTPETLSDLGSFGGLFRVPSGYKEPVLVASTDGVGTKLKLAFATGRQDTVGRDLGNHCVKDIFVQAARPRCFLDYVAPGLGASVGDVLLTEHRSYYRPLAGSVEEGLVKGLAHITGGGLTDNLPRILPPGVRARIERGTWRVPPVFEVIGREGEVEEG